MEEKKVIIQGEELYHYGILGQKWGVRRYENADGTLTEAGKERYYKEYKKFKRFSLRRDKGFREQIDENMDINTKYYQHLEKNKRRKDQKLEKIDPDDERARRKIESKYEKKLANSDLAKEKFDSDAELMKRAEEKVRGYLGDSYNLRLDSSANSKTVGEDYVDRLIADYRNRRIFDMYFG